MNDFYRKFEDKFRGSRELIYDRLKVYLEFVIPLQRLYPNELWVDLGCGRGEWLELLSSANINSLGVDVDEEMLSACIDLGLNACLCDAVSFLESKPEESFIGITAFHVAEHLSSNELHKLIEQSFRVLKPGGVLIIETPNPENIVVGSCGFYLDPTHVKPIPPPLLEFMSSYYGFYRSLTLRLQEPEQVVTSGAKTLMDVFSGVSPDYAIVVQKEPNDIDHDPLSTAFSKKTGLTLEELAMDYHEKNAGLLKVNSAKIDKELQVFSELLNGMNLDINSKLELIIKDLSTGFGEEKKLLESKIDELTRRAVKAEADLAELYKSRSWRITRPLRLLSFWFKSLFLWKSVFYSANYFFGKAFGGLIDFLYRHPRVKKQLSKIIRSLGLYSVLYRVYFQLSNTMRGGEKEEAFSYKNSGGSSEGASSLGNLSIEEILARIDAELTTVNQGRRSN